MSKDKLIDDIAAFTHDPLGYANYAYDWGSGELTGEEGPREWQTQILTKVGEHLSNPETRFMPLLIAVASGHGIGKSAAISILLNWGLSTCEDCKIVVTANTETQLRTKTWPEALKWHRLSITKDWFNPTATAISSVVKDHDKSWRADAVTWSITNTEAFAGLHNKKKRIIVVFDEASSIHNKVWEVTEGALTDEETEIIWIAFGNPTRNTGRFRECFGRYKHRWVTMQIDSRTVKGTNKAQIEKWREDYGEDSDFFKVRVRGQFPSASSLQLIPSDIVSQAMTRDIPYTKGDALIMALDVARGGDDNCVFRFRRGFDARSIKPVKIPGAEVKDSMRLVSVAAELLALHKPDQFFFDGTGVGGPVGDRIRQMGFRVQEVQFAGQSPDPKLANMRAYMWVKMRDWLRAGGCIDNDPTLETDLTSVEYFHNSQDKLILEPKDAMKKRGLASPDDADALAMTFAYPVAPVFGPGSTRGKVVSEYDPFR